MHYKATRVSMLGRTFIDTTNMQKAQLELLERIYQDTGVDAKYMLENDKPEDVDEFIEKCEELINEDEVIYYHNAMAYLLENDPSLEISLGIADEFGYTTDRLNSELLATLLKQQNAREALGELRDEIDELIFNYDYVHDNDVCPSSLGEDDKPVDENETAHKWNNTENPVICSECGTTRDVENV